MTYAKPHYVSFDDVRDRDADHSGIKADGVTFTRCNFDRCSFHRLQTPDVCFGGMRKTSVYRDCDFTGSRFRSIAPGVARFERCRFEDVKIDMMLCMEVDFVGCVFSGRIKGSFINAHWIRRTKDGVVEEERHNEIVHNDFSRCELVDFDFRTGVDLRKQRLPEGPEYLVAWDVPRLLPRLREEVARWEHEDLRRRAIASLKTMEKFATDGQRDQFRSAVGNTYGFRAAGRALIDLIRTMQ